AVERCAEAARNLVLIVLAREVDRAERRTGDPGRKRVVHVIRRNRERAQRLRRELGLTATLVKKAVHAYTQIVENAVGALAEQRLGIFRLVQIVDRGEVVTVGVEIVNLEVTLGRAQLIQLAPRLGRIE